MKGPTQARSTVAERSRSSVERPLVALSVKSFPPAFRSGGPTRSVEALVEHLGSEAEFRVVTSLDDNGFDLRSVGIPARRWEWRSGALVSAIPGNGCAFYRAVQQLRLAGADTVYLNSLFHPTFSLAPLLAARLGWLRPRRVVVAPRGELDPGAFTLKSFRKRAMVKLLRRLGLVRAVVWHATSAEEARQIVAAFGATASVTVASNLRSMAVPPVSLPPAARPMEVVFLSKIDRKKNLETAIRAVADHPDARLTVIGPIKDQDYWEEICQFVAASNLGHRFVYAGPIEPDQVVSQLREFDLFLLPTRGENFGHAILEALAAGLPVAIGKDTPWSGVAEEAAAGWAVSAENAAAFTECLRRYEALGPTERLAMRRRAAEIAQAYLRNPEPLEAHRRLLLSGLRGP